MKKEKICIIGIGKVGSAFALELSEAGYKVKYLIDTDKSLLKKFTKKIKNSISFNEINEKVISGADIIFLTIQDVKLKDTISIIKNLEIDLSGKLFIHTSGSISSEVFQPLKLNKDNIASFHPIQTFNTVSTKNDHLLQSIHFGIEGGKMAVKYLTETASKLKSSVLMIPASKKPLYHLASVIASNFLITNLAIMREILSKAGLKDADVYEVYKGIINNTFKNVKEFGIHNALTGPIERNDIETIGSHMEYLRKYLPDLENYYKEVSKMTSKVALKKGSLNKKQFEELNRHLKN